MYNYRITPQTAWRLFEAYSLHQSRVLIDRRKRACRCCKPIATNHDNTASSLGLALHCDKATGHSYMFQVGMADLDGSKDCKDISHGQLLILELETTHF
jgi:hypothetical protein